MRRINLGDQAVKYYDPGVHESGTIPNKVHPPSFYSDRRLKNVKGENKAGLEEVRKLKVFDYTFKKDENKTPRVGVIAQDLQKVFPDAVTKGEDGYLRIRMEDMFYAVVNSVKELDKLVQGLVNDVKQILEKLTAYDKEIQSLKQENAELKARIDKLEKLIK